MEGLDKMSKEVVAGIVLYNPVLQKLEKNILSIQRQVDQLILIDNHSSNIGGIIELIEKLQTEFAISIKLIMNSYNKGIAEALNQIMHFSYENKYKWFLTLDQDTECPDKLVEKMLDYYYVCDFRDKVVVICPEFIDINNIRKSTYMSDREMEPDTGRSELTTITSGSLNRVDISYEIGGFETKLFIDHVDHEFCLKLNKLGFKIMKLNAIVIKHEIGNITRHKLLWTTVATSNHSYIRRYYYYRNSIFLLKKYFSFFPLWTSKIILHDLLNLFKITFYESDKRKKLKYAFKGLYDGITNNYGDVSKSNGGVK